MDIDTWVSILATTSAIVALYFSLRRELKAEVADVKGEIGRLEGRVNTLDDRVYGLAVGLKPVIDEAAARASKA